MATKEPQRGRQKIKMTKLKTQVKASNFLKKTLRHLQKR